METATELESPKLSEIHKKILVQISEHERWIQANCYDADGAKERKEWIEECQNLLVNLGVENE